MVDGKARGRTKNLEGVGDGACGSAEKGVRVGWAALRSQEAPWREGDR